jgi:hypothetical protein
VGQYAGLVLVRQSNARGDLVMESTKTAIDQEIAVPAELLQVLRWHVETQLRPGPQRESTLLFPSEIGGSRSRSCLDKPFADVAKAIELKKHISRRAMRRTFQDLARTAEVRDIVTRSISAAFPATRWITLRPPGRARSPGHVAHDPAARWIRGTRPLKVTWSWATSASAGGAFRRTPRPS